MSKDKTCNTCKHWKNQQAELEYSQFNGICTCYKWEFSTTGDADCKVLDRANIKPDKHMGVNRFESQKNVVPHLEVNKSRYCLVTDEHFGCIHYTIIEK